LYIFKVARSGNSGYRNVDSTETMRFKWCYFEGVWALDGSKLDITASAGPINNPAHANSATSPRIKKETRVLTVSVPPLTRAMRRVRRPKMIDTKAKTRATVICGVTGVLVNVNSIW